MSQSFGGETPRAHNQTWHRKVARYLVLIESGGDNLAATFSPELADLTVYVIDVAGGEKIPRKGGPGITRSDLLVVNKTDLAPHVGASLAVMEADTIRMRRGKPYVFASIRSGDGVEAVAAFIASAGGLPARAAADLLSCLGALIDGRYGGRIVKRYLTQLRLTTPA